MLMIIVAVIVSAVILFLLLQYFFKGTNVTSPPSKTKSYTDIHGVNHYLDDPNDQDDQYLPNNKSVGVSYRGGNDSIIGFG
jgi:hypothetical protein